MFSKSENDKVSIEHILPQTPTKWYWRNQFRQFVKNPEEMDFLTGALGNLLPLSQSINSSLQNDSFEEKKNPTKEGRRGYSSGSNSEIEVAKENEWNAQKIHERTMELLKFMSERWNLSIDENQMKSLTFDEFIFDDRTIPEELPIDNEQVDELTGGETHSEIRLKYWAYAIPIIRKAHGGEGHPYGNINPKDSNYLDGFFGTGGIHLVCAFRTKNPIHCSAGLWIDTGRKETSKALFDLLYSHKAEIEEKVSMPISWDRKEDSRASSIDFILEGVNVADSSQWNAASEFHAKMSKELADFIFYPYEDEIKDLNKDN